MITTQKSTRAAAQKGARARRASQAGAKQPKPMIRRLEGDTELVAPPGCHATVLLKLVHRDDGHRYYSWWAVVGRHDMDTMSVHYKYTGEDTIRFDLPRGVPLSAESLQRHLTAFLAEQQEQEGDTPIIIDE